MDCDVDLAKFTERPYVVERPAAGDFADVVTDMLARAGLRLEFGSAAHVVRDHDNILADSLPSGTGIISRSGNRIVDAGATTFVSGAARVAPYASASQPAVEMAFEGLTMAGHTLAGPDRATAIAFASMMTMRSGATRETLLSIGGKLSDDSASLAWNSAARIPGYVDACRTQLENSPTFKTATAISVERNARIIALGALKSEYRIHAGPEDRLLLDLRGRMEKGLGLKTEQPSSAIRLATELGDRNAGPSQVEEVEKEYPFEARPFGQKHFGPSYLPTQKFNEESLRVVQGLHPDLLKVVQRASEISEQDFQVVPGNGGLRSKTMQRKLKAKGASRATVGRHTFGYAIDLVPVDSKGRVDFKNLAGFDEIMRSMKQASEELGIPIDWGGNWKRLVDKPHFELNRKVYPGPNETAKPEDVLVAFR
jgi:peptidoglycan L-alanyl-D-glutamate endopeptidase CwlK